MVTTRRNNPADGTARDGTQPDQQPPAINQGDQQPPEGEVQQPPHQGEQGGNPPLIPQNVAANAGQFMAVNLPPLLSVRKCDSP